MSDITAEYIVFVTFVTKKWAQNLEINIMSHNFKRQISLALSFQRYFVAKCDETTRDSHDIINNIINSALIKQRG